MIQPPDILINVFLAIAVDNLANANILMEGEKEEDDEEDEEKNLQVVLLDK